MNIVDKRIQLKEAISKRDAAQATGRKMLEVAELEKREFSPEETAAFAEVKSVIAEMNPLISQLQSTISNLESLEGSEPAEAPAPAPAERSHKPQASSYAFPNIAVDTKVERSYDFTMACRSYAADKVLKGFEGEWHQELIRNQPTKEGGFMLPMHVKMAGLRADFTTTTGSSTVVTHVDSTPIEYLRNRMVLTNAGARFITNVPPGIYKMPRQTGTTTAAWVTEGNATGATAATINTSLDLTPQTLTAYTNITRLMINQSAVNDLKGYLGKDLLDSTGVTLDKTGLTGTGSSQPTGILNDSNVPTIAIGTNGGAMTYATSLVLEKSVAESNADYGKMSVVTSPAGRATLKSTVKESGYPNYLWSDDNKFVGVDAFVSNQVPKNLTKGTATNTCTAIVYGNFDEYIMATWGEGIEIVEDPYSMATSGGKRLIVLVDAAMGVREIGALAKIVDFVY